ncbi:MAG TPA: isoprenylcysteine carboxylmethyltransferase family protein [Pseudolabrys sp.]|nr:isoprenylcysteine carboxylmethyltransferase family protein [Pseudolabrys sp.]
MSRIIALRFGEIAYFTLFAAVGHAIFFVENMVVPKTIDAGGLMTPTSQAIVIDLLLMTIFALLHSVMARQGVKRWWAKLVPVSVGRSAYVFIASVSLLAVMWLWRPMPETVWHVASPPAVLALTAVSFLGWLFFFVGSFVITNWELFGLRHIGDYVQDSVMPEPAPLSYRLTRHLSHLGIIIAAWSAPIMTTGHLLFASVIPVYILVGAVLKESTMIDWVGRLFRRYRERAAIAAPWRRSIRAGTRGA